MLFSSIPHLLQEPCVSDPESHRGHGPFLHSLLEVHSVGSTRTLELKLFVYARLLADSRRISGGVSCYQIGKVDNPK